MPTGVTPVRGRFATGFTRAPGPGRGCGRTRVAGRNHLTVRQPDGTLACLPEWMTSPHAAAFEVRDFPVPPARALVDAARCRRCVLPLADGTDEGAKVRIPTHLTAIPATRDRVRSGRGSASREGLRWRSPSSRRRGKRARHPPREETALRREAAVKRHRNLRQAPESAGGKARRTGRRARPAPVLVAGEAAHAVQAVPDAPTVARRVARFPGSGALRVGRGRAPGHPGAAPADPGVGAPVRCAAPGVAREGRHGRPARRRGGRRRRGRRRSMRPGPRRRFHGGARRRSRSPRGLRGCSPGCP